MVKLQDFVIAGLLFFAVILGAVIFFGDSAQSYGISVENVSFVNTSKLNELVDTNKEAEEGLDLSEVGDEDSLVAIVKKAIGSARVIQSSASILYEFFGNIGSEYGVPPAFITIIIAILSIIFVGLLIALFTGRFV